MATRITRKQLKKDRFAEEVGHQVSYIRQHRTKVTVLAVLLVVAIVGGSGFYRYRAQQAAAARRAFQDSMNVFHGTVALDQKEGQVTFATSIEKEMRTTEALEKVINDHSGRFEGRAAELYRAMFDLEMGEYDEGRTKLEALIGDSNKDLGALSRMGLADLLRHQGKLDESRKHYEYLVEDPSAMVPKVRAQLALITVLKETDPDDAAKTLREIQEGGGAGAEQAARALAVVQQEQMRATAAPTP